MPQMVLIIEDDPDTRSIYRAALEERGYRVATATQGAEGVHLARHLHPSLILLDIRMPVLDGWSALRYLSSYQETRSIPVYGISAYVSEEEVREAGSPGFERFLMKPMDPVELVAAVEERIGPPRSSSPPNYPLSNQ